MLLHVSEFHFLRLYYFILCVCVCHIFFIHSSIDRHLGCFPMLPIMNNAAVNMGVQICFIDIYFISFEYILKSGSEVLDHMVLLFLIL